MGYIKSKGDCAMKWKDNGTDIEFTINEYKPVKNFWCDVTLKVNNKYFNYLETGEILESQDVDSILDCIERLLDRKMYHPEEIFFTEPYISFVFYPPRLEREVCKLIPLDNVDALTDIYAKMIFELELDEGFGGHYYILELCEEELKNLKNYLVKVVNK